MGKLGYRRTREMNKPSNTLEAHCLNVERKQNLHPEKEVSGF